MGKRQSFKLNGAGKIGKLHQKKNEIGLFTNIIHNNKFQMDFFLFLFYFLRSGGTVDVPTVDNWNLLVY